MPRLREWQPRQPGKETKGVDNQENTLRGKAQSKTLARNYENIQPKLLLTPGGGVLGSQASEHPLEILVSALGLAVSYWMES